MISRRSLIQGLFAAPAMAEGNSEMTIVTLGAGSGAGAVNSDNSTLVGEYAGYDLRDSHHSVVYGNCSGQFLRSAVYGTVIGPSAGRYANGAEGAVMLGLAAGYISVNVNYSILVGYAAGRAIVDGNTHSLIIGYAAGEYSHRSNFSVFGGMHAGYAASDSEKSVAIGHFAGAWADHSPKSVFIGPEAGGVYKTDAQTEIPSAHHVERGVYIGSCAGKDSANTADVVLIGTGTKADSGVENAVALGKGAHATADNQLVIAPELDVRFGANGDSLAQIVLDLQARITALEAA